MASTPSIARRCASFSVLALALCSPWLLNCGAAGGKLGGLGDITGGALGGQCPKLDVETLAAYDFAANFKIQADAAAKLQAGAIAAVELKAFADSVDADLKVACGGLAKDLGAAGDPKNGQEACKLAAKAIGDFKGKLGAKAQINLVVKPPVCRADLNVMANCAAKCDAHVKPGEVKAQCEPGKLSGECSGQCSGSCDAKVAAKCEGTCSGKCDVKVKGKCGGTCDGKCDGKDGKGSCSGTCDGKCDGNVEGECSGKCEGSCKLKASAQCDGSCTGECKGEFKAPKCTGEVKPPEMSAECKGRCDAQVSGHMECTPAQVGVGISGEVDAKLVAQFKGAMEKNLPIILKVAIGMGERAGKMAANGKAVVEGVSGSIDAIAKTSGGGGAAAMTAGKITACLGAPFKGAIDAAGSLQANVSVSVEVKASAEAKGSAGGSAGGKTEP